MGISKKSIHEFTDLSKITTYQAGALQTQAYRKLKRVTSVLVREHNMTMMEWFVIGFVKDAGKSGIRITDLARILQTTLPYMTNIVNTLVNKRMIERVDDRTDNRAKLVKLLPSTQKLCRDVENDLRKKMRDVIYSNISPKELHTYIKVLYQIANLKT